MTVECECTTHVNMVVRPSPQVPDVDASVDAPNVSGDESLPSASVAVPGERLLYAPSCGSIQAAFGPVLGV